MQRLFASAAIVMSVVIVGMGVPVHGAATPTGTITSGPPDGTSGGAVAFTYSKDDPEATFRCRLVGPGRDETKRAPDGYLSGWPRVVNECLNRIGRGEPPPATARDCARAVSLIFDAYRMAGETVARS